MGDAKVSDESFDPVVLLVALRTFYFVASDWLFERNIFGVVLFVAGDVFVAFFHCVVLLPGGDWLFRAEFAAVAHNRRFGPFGRAEFDVPVGMHCSHVRIQRRKLTRVHLHLTVRTVASGRSYSQRSVGQGAIDEAFFLQRRVHVVPRFRFDSAEQF